MLKDKRVKESSFSLPRLLSFLISCARCFQEKLERLCSWRLTLLLHFEHFQPQRPMRTVGDGANLRMQGDTIVIPNRHAMLLVIAFHWEEGSLRWCTSEEYNLNYISLCCGNCLSTGIKTDFLREELLLLFWQLQCNVTGMYCLRTTKKIDQESWPRKVIKY